MNNQDLAQEIRTDFQTLKLLCGLKRKALYPRCCSTNTLAAVEFDSTDGHKHGRSSTDWQKH